MANTKELLKEQQTQKLQRARRPYKQQYTTPADCRGVKKLNYNYSY